MMTFKIKPWLVVLLGLVSGSLAAAKYWGLVDWPWVWVLSPLWIVAALGIGLATMLILIQATG